MNKSISAVVIVLSILAPNLVLALACPDDPEYNRINMNNYILKYNTFNIESNNVIKSEFIESKEHSLSDDYFDSIETKTLFEYDESGLLIKKYYDYYSNDELVYIERLDKTSQGWIKVNQDFEYNKKNTHYYIVNEMGAIIESKSALIPNNDNKDKTPRILNESYTTYEYDSNQCITQRKRTDIDKKENEESTLNEIFHYANGQLQKISVFYSSDEEYIRQFQHELKFNETGLLTQYHIESLDAKNGDVILNMEYLTFNDKGDWITAKESPLYNTYKEYKRVITYYE